MIKAVNFTKKDEINSMSSTPLQKVTGETVHVLGAALTERPDEQTGEAKKVGILVTEEFGTLSTISGTAIKSLDMIIDYMTDLTGDPDTADENTVAVDWLSVHSDFASRSSLDQCICRASDRGNCSCGSVLWHSLL